MGFPVSHDPVKTVRRRVTIDPPHLGRLPLCVRIGVTGHRWEEPAAHVPGEVDEAIDDVLAAAATGGDAVPTAVSALADGADRLVAEQVLARPGGRLEVVLPMEPGPYEATFLDGRTSQHQFEQLLERASSVEVVVDESESTKAFLAAGAAMVDRADSVVAVWDGLEAKGEGGTGDVVGLVRARGLPMLRVSPDRGGLGRERLPADGPGLPGLGHDVRDGVHSYNAVRIDETRYRSAVAEAGKELGREDPDNAVRSH